MESRPPRPLLHAADDGDVSVATRSRPTDRRLVLAGMFSPDALPRTARELEQAQDTGTTDAVTEQARREIADSDAKPPALGRATRRPPTLKIVTGWMAEARAQRAAAEARWGRPVRRSGRTDEFAIGQRTRPATGRAPSRSGHDPMIRCIGIAACWAVAELMLIGCLEDSCRQRRFDARSGWCVKQPADQAGSSECRRATTRTVRATDPILTFEG